MKDAVEMGQYARDLEDRVAAEEVRLRGEIKAKGVEIHRLRVQVIMSCALEAK
jgi:hypothetical protein